MKYDAPARPGRVRERYQGPLTLSDPAWYERALCGDTGTDFFFSEYWEDRVYAKSVCARCPVESDCLIYALQNRVRHGVWGGKGEMERIELLDLSEPDWRREDRGADDDGEADAA